MVSSDTPRSPLAIFVQTPGRVFSSLRRVRQDHAPLFGILGRVELRYLSCGFEFQSLVDKQRGIAAVIDDLNRTGAIGPAQGLDRAPPVFFQRLALPREDGNAAWVRGRTASFGTSDHDRRSRMILGREDVARNPADVGAQSSECLDEHGSLNGHVKAAHDLHAGQRLLCGIAITDDHQSRHFLFRKLHFLAAKLRQTQIFYFERFTPCLTSCFEGRGCDGCRHVLNSFVFCERARNKQ